MIQCTYNAIVLIKIYTMKKTYDIHFNDNNNCNSKGFELPTINDGKEYIACFNGTNHSYFKEYKGGTVSVICNQTGEVAYEEIIF